MATSTQSAQGVRSNLSVGRYLNGATAAAITITCGFKPRVVRVLNNTSMDELTWAEGMAAGSGFKRVAAGGATAIAANGITVSEHSFVIGLDTDINVINEQLTWIAQG